jgi:anti-sigma factor RsiW
MSADNSKSQSAQDQTLLVHAYLDGELDPFNTLAIKRRIETDAELSAELANASAVQRALREGFPREPVPEQLLRRIDVAIGKTVASTKPSWGALAASVLIAISASSGATWLATQTPAGDSVMLEVVDSHMRSLLATKGTDVDASERHIVKPWFNGRVPQAPRVVDLASVGFPLKGARIDVIGRTPVPTLVYTRRLHVISLVAFPASSIFNRSSERSLNGYNIVRWTDGNTSYWATSDLNAQELESFGKLFREAPSG